MLLRKWLACIALLLAFAPLQAQVIPAQDWTQTGCDGIVHNLYDELDSGDVVIMEIVMLDGCMPCINAAHLIGPIIDSYNAMYDNRIRYYTFGYNDTYTCVQLESWKTENDITCETSFVEGADISEYYGGMGMPTIVVAGRAAHEVSFYKFGFSVYDTARFQMAIEYALGNTDQLGVNCSTHSINILSFPNPVNNVLSLEVAPDGDVFIYDIAGNLVRQVFTTGQQIDVSALPAGFYTIKTLTLQGLAEGNFIKY